MTDGITDPGNNNILQSFSDATAGRSLQTYYLMAATKSGGVDYIISRASGHSEPTDLSTGDTAEFDFDMTINKATIFQGIGTIDFTFGLAVGSGSSSSVVVFTVIHYDGSTETTIGTATSATKSASVPTDWVSKLKVDITRQLFGIGHILRVTAALTNTGVLQTVLYVDADTAGKELILHMPVVNLE